jgi:CubicO group peptidase (beta-lactamase class C family)
MKLARCTFLWLFATLCSVPTTYALDIDSKAQKAGPKTESKQLAPPSPRDFAYAMEKREPLQVIKGGSDTPVCVPAADLADDPSTAFPAQFAEVVSFAESTGSYSLIVWKDGSCQLEKYFPPFDRDTRPESASMHKSIVALLVAAAIGDGSISGPDARAGDHLPEWANDPRGDITLRQLLTMSSGLQSLSMEGGPESPGMRYIMNPDDARAATLGLLAGDEPGTVFNYLGANTQLLLMILESATGMKYVDYASTRLWQPLEAADSYVWMYVQPPMPRAYMSLLAPARNWLKAGLLIKDYGRYGGQQIISRELIEQATSPSRNNENYAWQMWLGTSYHSQRFYFQGETGPSVKMSEPFLVDDMIFFDGHGGQRVYISRSKDLVIVRQGDIRPDWDDARLPNLVIEAIDK